MRFFFALLVLFINVHLLLFSAQPKSSQYEYPNYSVSFPQGWQELSSEEQQRQRIAVATTLGLHVWGLEDTQGSTIALAEVFEDRTPRSLLSFDEKKEQFLKEMVDGLSQNGSAKILSQVETTINGNKVYSTAIISKSADATPTCILVYCVQWPVGSDYRACYLVFSLEARFVADLNEDIKEVITTFQSK